jgi:ribosomal peptide maturation radical SAM protein 1
VIEEPKTIESPNPKVLFASMPWASCVMPSLGLGILKAQLNKSQIESRIRSFNLFFLKYSSIKTYVSLADIYAINDSLFTYEFESGLSEEQIEMYKMVTKGVLQRGYFHNEKRYNTPERLLDMLIKARNQIVPDFLSDCLAYVQSYNPTMVGFTCMYDQTIASLALAKKIKEEYPDIFIVFGGYAVEGETGELLIKTFPFVDCVAFGEGEYLIEDLAKSSIDRELLANIPNICYRRKNSPIIYYTEEKNDFDINKSPCPDYDDFLLDIEEMSTQLQRDIYWQMIPITFSRGCWWGEKKHCVFCGINDKALKHSYKIPEVVLSNIMDLKNKYNKSKFLISDYILPYTYYNILLPRLAEINKSTDTPFTFSCEIKSNVKDNDFYMLKEAGFTDVQPGIESFSTNVLQKMNKGVTAIQNIYCLMLGIKYGISVNYNFLYGFPNDEYSDYDHLLKIIPMLYHLNYPMSFTPIIIARDSPLYKSGLKSGLEKPYSYHHSYDVLFSNAFKHQYHFDLNKYCYYFEKPFTASKELQMLYVLLSKQIQYWQESKKTRKVQLFYQEMDDTIVFTDSRYNEVGKVIKLDKIVADVYKACECIIIAHTKLISNLQHSYSFTEEDINSALDILIKNRLIYKENDLLLGLAFPEEIYNQK